MDEIINNYIKKTIQDSIKFKFELMKFIDKKKLDNIEIINFDFK